MHSQLWKLFITYTSSPCEGVRLKKYYHNTYNLQSTSNTHIVAFRSWKISAAETTGTWVMSTLFRACSGNVSVLIDFNLWVTCKLLQYFYWGILVWTTSLYPSWPRLHVVLLLINVRARDHWLKRSLIYFLY